MQRIFRIVLFLMLGLRKVAACVASRDPEDGPVPTTTIPPRSPCQTCALPIYRNNCDGLQRSPCPSATQANVVTTGSVADCTLQFNCPPNTRAFVWPAGRNTPVAYSGTDLVCAGAPDNEWRTDMGLRVDGLSCMGPVLLPGCTFCPTAVDMYRDCSYYGRMNCYTDVSMISADVQRVGTQCRMLVLCGPGTTFHYITATGATDTFTTIGSLTCSMPPSGGDWVMPNGVVITGMTCMSAT